MGRRGHGTSFDNNDDLHRRRQMMIAPTIHEDNDDGMQQSPSQMDEAPRASHEVVDLTKTGGLSPPNNDGGTHAAVPK